MSYARQAILISVGGGRIVARQFGCAHNETLRAAPGAKWNSAARCWEWTKTDAAARGIKSTLDNAGLTFNAGPEFMEMTGMTTAPAPRAGPVAAEEKTRSWEHQKRAFAFDFREGVVSSGVGVVFPGDSTVGR